MQEVLQHKGVDCSNGGLGNLFIVLCASGLETPARLRSALMFASLAAAADYRTILYCIQNAVDVMVNGVLERQEHPEPGVPTVAQRLREAVDMGVEIQCCTQTMANKKINPGDLMPRSNPCRRNEPDRSCVSC